VLDEFGSVLAVLTLNTILEAIVGDLPGPAEGLDEPSGRRAEDAPWLLMGRIAIDEFKTSSDRQLTQGTTNVGRPRHHAGRPQSRPPPTVVRVGLHRYEDRRWTACAGTKIRSLPVGIMSLGGRPNRAVSAGMVARHIRPSGDRPPRPDDSTPPKSTVRLRIREVGPTYRTKVELPSWSLVH